MPMSYRVELPVFSGPMDLLLHLVKQQEVDIHEIALLPNRQDLVYILHRRSPDTAERLVDSIGVFAEPVHMKDFRNLADL